MATDKQLAANRRNAKLSTGPRTSEGKANIRFNSLRHGLRAASIVLPSENQQDFDNLIGEIEDEFHPQTPSEHFLVQEMAIAQWKILRVDRAQNAIFLQDPIGLDHLPALDRLGQHEARLQRSWFRAYKELDRIKRLHQKELSQRLKEEHENETDLEDPSHTPRISPGLVWVNHETGEKTEVVAPSLVYPDGHSETLPPDDPRRQIQTRPPDPPATPEPPPSRPAPAEAQKDPCSRRQKR
jgi:hypothetical protein